MIETTHEEKYKTFLEATGMFGKDVTDLIADDVLRSHDMGIFVNNKVTEMQEELHDLRGFKSAISDLIGMFAHALVQEVTQLAAEDEDENEKSE